MGKCAVATSPRPFDQSFLFPLLIAGAAAAAVTGGGDGATFAMACASAGGVAADAVVDGRFGVVTLGVGGVGGATYSMGPDVVVGLTDFFSNVVALSPTASHATVNASARRFLTFDTFASNGVLGTPEEVMRYCIPIWWMWTAANILDGWLLNL